MQQLGRLSYAPVDGAAALFTPAFADFFVPLHDRFAPRIAGLRQKRAEVLHRALYQHQPPGPLPHDPVVSGNWQVPPLPAELLKPGIEITGPVSATTMAINALNPVPEGGRAEGYLDDDEDSAGHRLTDTVRATHNRLDAVLGRLAFTNPENGREYQVAPGELPFFMHRERGLALDETDVTIDGKPVAACLLGACLTLFYPGVAQAERGQGIYFYLPKLESAEEAGFWRDFFDAARAANPTLASATLRAILLVESLPLAYQMEEALYALGPYAAGLNAARWDFKASILEFIMADPNAVWPDRFGVDIKTTEFIGNIFRRLVATCLKHGAVAIGGMAPALPSRDEAVNQAAAASIHADKEWEARQGFMRGWVAHIYHMKTAADPFKELRASEWGPTPEMHNPDNYPIQVRVPEGPITLEGSRRNVRMIIEYVEGWLGGRGAKGIDTLAGRPGVHPALMEDLATGRISVAQTAQRILHAPVATDNGEPHGFPMIKRLFGEELADILRLGREAGPLDAETEERYRKAAQVGMHWVKNYTELNFRSLGSYTRAELDALAAASDAF